MRLSRKASIMFFYDRHVFFHVHAHYAFIFKYVYLYISITSLGFRVVPARA